MRHLNYNHLFYFWTVANEGSISRASEVLHITPQTISGQLKLLEESIGEALFHRVGRGMVLSDAGESVKGYADQIFQLGASLAEQVRSHQFGRPSSLRVGIVDSLAKSLASRMLEPLLCGEESVRIGCIEGSVTRLLGELAVHRIDVVISDQPVPRALSIKVSAVEIGASGIGFFVPRAMVKRGVSLERALTQLPVLLPSPNTEVRRKLDSWFERNDIEPTIAAEFEDGALMKAFGRRGTGIFPAPVIVRDDIADMYHARYLGEASGVQEHYFLVVASRRRKQPLLQQVLERASASLQSI